MKTGTKNRLIPAREESPRIGGLELRSEEHLLRACTLLLIFGIEKSAAKLIDFASELERACMLAIQLDCFPGGEGQLFEVGFNPDRVVDRPNMFWQFPGCAGEIERFFRVERTHSGTKIN